MIIVSSVIITYILFVIQLGLGSQLAIKGAMPNILLIAFLALMINKRSTQALIAAGLGGILIDIFSPFRFGLYTLIYLGIYFFGERLISKFIDESNFFIWTVIVGAAAVFAELPTLLATLSLAAFALNIIYTAVAGSLIYFLIIRLRPKEPIAMP